MLNDFVSEFLDYPMPIPQSSVYTESEVRKDLKLILEIATRSQLTRKTEKQGRILFSCKRYGRDCFSVHASLCRDGRVLMQGSAGKEKLYMIDDDFRYLRHNHRCEKESQTALYFKTYCLIQLKRGEIQTFMIKNNLMSKEPSEILIKFSRRSEQPVGKEKYFFDRYIKKNELRKSLKKKFDNIINIDIKARIKKKGKKAREISEGKDQQKQNKIYQQMDRDRNQNPTKDKGVAIPRSVEKKVDSAANVFLESYSTYVCKPENDPDNSENPHQKGSQLLISHEILDEIDEFRILKETVNESWFEDEFKKTPKLQTPGQHQFHEKEREDVSFFGLGHAFPVSKEHFQFGENKAEGNQEISQKI